MAATFLEAIKNKHARQTFGVRIIANARVGGYRFLYVSTEVLAATEPTGGTLNYYQPGLLALGGLKTDGAAGAPSVTTEVQLEIANKVLADLAVGPVEAATQVRTTWWLGAQVQVELLVEHPNGEWFSQDVFLGHIQTTRLTHRGMELRATSLERERVLIPTKMVSEDSMVYGGLEGKRPDGWAAAVSPIGFGWFHPAAMDKSLDMSTADSRNVPWGGQQGSVLAPAIGIKCPMWPVVMLADHYQAKDSTTPLTDGRFVLGALGDLEGAAAYPSKDLSIRCVAPGDRNRTQDPLVPMYPSLGALPAQEEVYWQRIFTWNKELGVAMPFLKDRSRNATNPPPVAEEPYASAGDWGDQHGDSSHTAETGDQRLVQTPYIARADPDWGGTLPAYWMGTMQSVALLPDRLSQVGLLTAGATYGTTAGTVNPLHALNNNIAEYASLSGSNRLSLQMPATGPTLGDVLYVRLVFVCGAGPSRDVRVAARMTPALGFPMYPDAYTTQPVANQVKLDYNTGVDDDCWGSAILWWRGSYQNGHGLPPWTFYEIVGGAQSWAYDVVFWSGDGLEVKVYRAWLDVGYRPRNLNTVVERLEGTEDSVNETPWLWGTTLRSPQPYSGNIPGPEQRNLGRVQVYMTGMGPNDNSGGTFTYGHSNDPDLPIMHPAGIAGFCIDKYLDDLSSVESAAGAFGSFRDATAQLDALAGGADRDYRLTVVQDKRVSMRRFLDKLGEHCQGFFQRQVSGPTSHKWRMFVDTDDPATDCPGRLWRGAWTYLDSNDMIGEPSVELTPLSAIRNHFTLKYGYHIPSGTYAYERVLTSTATDLSTEASLYMTAMGDSQSRYAHASGEVLIQDEVLTLPWIWRPEVADAALKWHANLKRQQRLVVRFQGGLNTVDLEVGHYLKLGDMTDALGPYPGLNASSAWTAPRWQVISKVMRYTSLGHVVCDFALLEVYTVPT